MPTPRRVEILCFALLPLLALCQVVAQPGGVRPPEEISRRSGFLYKPSKGAFWDPTVIFANGLYYMYTMYGGDSVWLATSRDGVHWQDYGVVLKSEGFKNNRVWKQYVSNVGDRYINGLWRF